MKKAAKYRAIMGETTPKIAFSKNHGREWAAARS
jgi:hypothetical protein